MLKVLVAPSVSLTGEAGAKEIMSGAPEVTVSPVVVLSPVTFTSIVSIPKNPDKVHFRF